MRKFTLFIASLFLAVGAMAQVDYTPNFTGAKTRTTRLVSSVSVGNDTYAMPSGTRNSYTDLTSTQTYTVEAGATVTLGIANSGSEAGWMNAFVYVDMDNNGFTAGIAGDNYTPTGDLVSYSFYNQGYNDDNNGRNSAGTSISGGNRSTLALPNWTVPADLTPGEYRIRFKYDWCNINPAGNTEDYFKNSFTGHGGEIIDAKLIVEPAPVVYETEEIAIPTEDGVYRIYWKQNNRGYLAYHDSYPTKGVLADVTLGSYGSMHFNSATDPVELEWYLITSEKGNKYLFSAYNGKFLSYSEESADAAKAAYFDAARPCPITIEQNTVHTSYSIIKANVDGRDCLLSSGCGTASRTGYPIRWNSNISGDMGDGGSPLIFVKVIDFPVDEAILARAQAAINDYENPVEADVNFEWTTSTPWTAVEHSAYYTSTVFNDNELDGVKYIEGEVTVGGARTATVTFTYIDGGHKLNIRGVEVIDAMGNIVAGDYHVGTAGGSHVDNTYTVSVAEAGTYKVRCYAAEGNGDQFNHSHGSIVVSFAKLDVMELTKSVTFTAEYATLYLGYKVAIPAGVEAYVLTGVNPTWVELTQLHNVIPANTAVILKGTAASTYNFYYTSSEAEDVEINYLEGSIADRYVQGDAYVLGIPEGETEAALCPALLNKLDNTSFKNNANKAYLKVAPGAALSASLRFGEGTTGVEEVKTENGEVKTIFDLTGRRVEAITAPGIYIVNGKKVIVK